MNWNPFSGPYKYYFIVLLVVGAISFILWIVAVVGKRRIRQRLLRQYGERKNSRNDWVFSTLFSISLEIIIVVVLLGGTFQFLQYLIQEDFKSQQEQIDQEKEALEEQRREEERIAEQRREEEAKEAEEEQRKRTLIFQMSSYEPAIATLAAKEMREEGWLSDGSLRLNNFSNARLDGLNSDVLNAFVYEFTASGEEVGIEEKGISVEKCKVDLADSNLANSSFVAACLCTSNFRGAILDFADFSHANLDEAIFTGTQSRLANFSGTFAIDADFSSSNLKHSSFENANLDRANFSGASLEEVSLRGASMYGTTFDEQTVLPDHTKWSEAVDMEQFTNPEHPDFYHAVGIEIIRPPALFTMHETENYRVDDDFVVAGYPYGEYFIEIYTGESIGVNLICYVEE